MANIAASVRQRLLKLSRAQVGEVLVNVRGTIDGQDWLTGVQKDVAYTGINLADLRELCINVPSIDRQNPIASELDEIAADCIAIESIHIQKHSALSELNQTLLQKAVSGEPTAGKETPKANLKEEEVA